MTHELTPRVDRSLRNGDKTTNFSKTLKVLEKLPAEAITEAAGAIRDYMQSSACLAEREQEFRHSLQSLEAKNMTVEQKLDRLEKMLDDEKLTEADRSFIVRTICATVEKY